MQDEKLNTYVRIAKYLSRLSVMMWRIGEWLTHTHRKTVDQTNKHKEE